MRKKNFIYKISTNWRIFQKKKKNKRLFWLVKDFKKTNLRFQRKYCRIRKFWRIQLRRKLKANIYGEPQFCENPPITLRRENDYNFSPKLQNCTFRMNSSLAAATSSLLRVFALSAQFAREEVSVPFARSVVNDERWIRSDRSEHAWERIIPGPSLRVIYR